MPFSQKKRHCAKQEEYQKLGSGWKKLAALDKGSWSYQDNFWDEIEERNIERKIIRREDDIDFQSDSDSAYNINSPNKLIETFRGCVSKNNMLPWMWVQNIFGTSLRSTSRYWDTLLHYVILHYAILYCDSIKRTTEF